MKAALVGHGIGPSLTPGMHEAEGRALGLSYQYGRIDVASPRWTDTTLGAILDWAEEQQLAGLNITHPFKNAAAALMDRLEGSAADLGTVNTVVFRDGQRIGYSTDYSGFARAYTSFRKGRPDDHVLLVGAGGAGSAVALALIDEGVSQLSIHDVNRDRQQELAGILSDLRPGTPTQQQSDLNPEFLAKLDGAVNATPIGMAAHLGQTFDPRHLRQGAWVGDIVYFPLETALVRAARAGGHCVMTGDGMALYQAVDAFELITGITPDVVRMKASLNAMLGQDT